MSDVVITRHRRAQQVVGGLFLSLIVLSIFGGLHSSVASALTEGSIVPVLVFGSDAADQSQHTDTLMVSIFDPVGNKTSLLSVPRDTRVRLPGYLFTRVNEIFGFHLRKNKSREQSALRVRDGVEYILSSESRQVHIPYYLNVDYSGFVKLVDLLGGVWIDVDNPMNYDDKAGNLHIHFQPGRYMVQGADALRFVRFRGPTGDKGRIFRQQEFIRSMTKRLANPMAVLKFPRIIEAVYSSVDTNLTPWDFLYLVNAIRHTRYSDLGFYILPGQPRGPYWQIKRDTADRLVGRLFFGEISNEGFLEPVTPLEGQTTVNVWNASGERGSAYQITAFLRRSGFDVQEWGTYAAKQIPTRVIDRKGQIKNAQAVAAILGIQNVHSEPNPNALVDVEVVIGKDYQPPPGAQQ